MSLALDSINNENEAQQKSSNQMTKDSYDDEELDYEEEVEISKSNDNLKSDNKEDGEVVKEESQPELPSKKNLQDKDEGEIDSEEELEEGEVKEEKPQEPENEKLEKPKIDSENLYRINTSRKLPNITSDIRNNIRRIPERKNYYNNIYWQSNQNYNNRYPNQRNDRYIINNRPREHMSHLQQQSTESSWERRLKQARELISKAEKRKEEEEDFENKRYISNKNERSSPVEKRRRYSQNSSSEDEIERRHRLAYDAAPWNNPNFAPPPSTNYRRPNYYSSNRLAETYRDPWRRSKSPKNVTVRNRKDDMDTRYGELYKRDKSPSVSMSSLSSICSSSTNLSEKSGGRKLPYVRPNLDANRNRTELNDNETFYNEREYSGKTRFDRIPKKSNVPTSYPQDEDGERHSEPKSFDSWSESLSDSSSYYSNSDSDDSVKEDIKYSKRSSNNNRLQALRTNDKKIQNDNKKSIVETKDSGLKSLSKYQTAEHSVSKTPIKMTFMKKQQSLKKDTIINEQLNGNISEESSNSQSSNKSKRSNKSEEKNEEIFEDKNQPKASSSLPPKDPALINETKEVLLKKLKAVEAAIKRRLKKK